MSSSHCLDNPAQKPPHEVGFLGLKRAIVNYWTALTINVGLLMGPAEATSDKPPTPIFLIHEFQLIDDCWHPGELVGNGTERRRVISIDARPGDVLGSTRPWISLN
jgi:hypothetical protein